MKLRYLLLPIAALAIGAFAADVSTDYNHNADFARYHTYSWIGASAGDQIWQDRIMAAVDNQLAAKGWMKVPSGGDAAVSAFGKTMEKQTLQNFL